MKWILGPGLLLALLLALALSMGRGQGAQRDAENEAACGAARLVAERVCVLGADEDVELCARAERTMRLDCPK